MKKIYPLVLAGLLTFGLIGCFSSLPAIFEASLTKEPNLSSEFDLATATLEIHPVDNEVHVNIAEIPASGDDCMYMAHATLEDGDVVALGMMTEEAEEAHEEEGEHEEEHEEEEEMGLSVAGVSKNSEGHVMAEMEAHGTELGINVHEITKVEIFKECEGSDSATKLFTATLSEAEGADDSTEASEGGDHTH